MKRNIKSTTFFFVLLVGVISFFACKRDYKGEYLAPEMKVASSNFAFLDTLKANYFNGLRASTDTISFSRDSLTTKPDPRDPRKTIPGPTYHYPRNTFFKVTFNESVRWSVTIRGLESNAQKVLSGVSSTLDTTIVDNLWAGSADGTTHFIQGEKAIVSLSVLGSEKTQTDTVVIARIPVYSAKEAVVLNDFEGGFPIITYGDNLDPLNPVPDVTTGIVPPQGKGSLLIEGTDNNGDYFIGGYQQVLDSNTLAKATASEIYINMYVYGFGAERKLTPNATKLNVGVSEDDNKDGTFDAKTEDSFEQQVNVDWQGWKLISVRYSNLKASTSRSNGGNGNNKLEPQKATSVNVNLISSPNGSTVAAALDYVIITFGKPYSK